MSAERSYLDSSALVKLVIQEPESRPLETHVRSARGLASCGLARVEVVRAVRPMGREAVANARALLRELDLVPLDDALLDAAADLQDGRLRSLDAVHVAAALMLAEDLTELITYDARMADAARAAGLRVSSPA